MRKTTCQSLATSSLLALFLSIFTVTCRVKTMARWAPVLRFPISRIGTTETKIHEKLLETEWFPLKFPVNTLNISKPLKSIFTFPKDFDPEKSTFGPAHDSTSGTSRPKSSASLLLGHQGGHPPRNCSERLVGNIGSSTNRGFLIDKQRQKSNAFFVNHMKKHFYFIKSLINHHRYTGYSLL